MIRKKIFDNLTFVLLLYTILHHFYIWQFISNYSKEEKYRQITRCVDKIRETGMEAEEIDDFILVNSSKTVILDEKYNIQMTIEQYNTITLKSASETKLVRNLLNHFFSGDQLAELGVSDLQKDHEPIWSSILCNSIKFKSSYIQIFLLTCIIRLNCRLGSEKPI